MFDVYYFSALVVYLGQNETTLTNGIIIVRFEQHLTALFYLAKGTSSHDNIFACYHSHTTKNQKHLRLSQAVQINLRLPPSHFDLCPPIRAETEPVYLNRRICPWWQFKVVFQKQMAHKNLDLICSKETSWTCVLAVAKSDLFHVSLVWSSARTTRRGTYESLDWS